MEMMTAGCCTCRYTRVSRSDASTHDAQQAASKANALASAASRFATGGSWWKSPMATCVLGFQSPTLLAAAGGSRTWQHVC